MLRAGTVLLALSLGAAAGCNRAVLKVETDPADGVVSIGGKPSKDNRWSLKAYSAAEIKVVWPDGAVVTSTLAADRDAVIKIRKAGAPKAVGGRFLAARGPNGLALGIEAPPPDPKAKVTHDADQAPDAFAQARQLFADGQRAYELADYDLAIAKFKEAYELIRQAGSPDSAEILTNVIFNLAVVYEKSFELTPEPERLRKARIMYGQYDEQMGQLAADWSSSGEHQEVQARIKAIEGQLADLDKKK
ncbi:MAG: hypothetical protein R3B09_16715 [Nannocystaceae bacterium]